MDMKILVYGLSGVFTVFAEVFCWHKLLDRKINFRSYKFYIALIIMVVFGMLIALVVPQYLKAFPLLIVFLFVNYIFFCRNLVESILTVIMSKLIAMVSELIFVLLVTIIAGDNAMDFTTNGWGVVISNISIALLMLVAMKLKFIYKIYNYLLSVFENMKYNNLITYSLLTIILVSIFMIMSYIKLPSTVVLICNTLLVIVYAGIVIKLANSQENYRKINSKYETSLSSLKEYEDMMDRYRIYNHENKNQLLTIRNMVKAKDKNVPNYIDKLIDNKIADNENIFYKTSKIPEGGLRATIYSKLCKIKDANIDYILDIANDVRTVDIIDIGETTMLNVCKIIGVFLDNAIEETSKIEKKEITIELFLMDDSLCIDISNYYEGVIEVDKLEKAKYTTKGDGHGYGLALVSELVRDDPNLQNEKKISCKRFTQSLKIKIK